MIPFLFVFLRYFALLADSVSNLRRELRSFYIVCIQPNTWKDREKCQLLYHLTNFGNTMWIRDNMYLSTDTKYRKISSYENYSHIYENTFKIGHFFSTAILMYWLKVRIGAHLFQILSNWLFFHRNSIRWIVLVRFIAAQIAIIHSMQFLITRVCVTVIFVGWPCILIM